MYNELFQRLIQPAETKIVLLIMDGLGGLPCEPGGKTELETAHTPNLDALARQSALGLTIPVGPGIAPGSGPGHLAIFGYDPVQNEIGRGALEALGVDFDLGPEDIAARGNFCTLDEAGLLVDRRAGRLPSEVSQRLIERLGTIQIQGAQFFTRLVKEHRFAFVMRGPGLGEALTDTDPLKTGLPPSLVIATQPGSEKAARLANQFVSQANDLLAGERPANGILLRGFARLPAVPSLAERFGLKAAAIALNGMYRGVARMAGMQILDPAGESPAGEFTTLTRCWNEFDFFYIHIKKTDTCGENGDFAGKVRAIEEVDQQIPRLLALAPEVVIVGGDHSTPAVLKAHSSHPVPVLLYGKQVRPDGLTEFGERACARGSLASLPARDILPLALGYAGRVAKYGA